ncbi:MAG: MerR family transcriptional regulator [Cyanobacteria bacterium P01_G01_bin.49]
MSELMKIGELARQTGLSIRTLHYYDEIGLLSPSHRTEVGYRLYSNQDIMRLQQIVSLRQLGFSLKEISQLLENPDCSFQQTIDLHRARIEEQMILSRTLLDRLNVISRELQTTKSVAVDNLIQVMETISMSKQQYFTPEQQEILEERFRQAEAEWQEILTQVHTEMVKGTDLNSPIVQGLVRRWQAVMKFLICGDEQIYDSLVKMYQQEEVEAASWGAMDAATFEYLLKATSFLSLGEDMDIVLSDKNYTTDAIQVIRLGIEAINQLNFDFFGTEGMLLGFLAEDTCVASQVLKSMGVSFEVVQHQIVQILGKRLASPLGVAVPKRIPFVPRAKRVLELARQQVNKSGQKRINSEYLLLGILKETQESKEAEETVGVAACILQESLGIDLVKLEQQLRLAMS